MTKLDWSKGYTLDPARVLPEQDLLATRRRTGKAAENPRQIAGADHLARPRNGWATALRALSDKNKQTTPEQPGVSRKTLLKALGINERKGTIKKRAAILRELRRNGIILPTGHPNQAHPKVQEVMEQLASRPKGNVKR